MDWDLFRLEEKKLEFLKETENENKSIADDDVAYYRSLPYAKYLEYSY